MNSHEMNVRILFSLELFSTHVTRTMHMKFHMGIKLVLFSKGLLTALLCAFVICAVFSSKVPPEGGQGKHHGNVAHMTGILGGLLLVLLVGDLPDGGLLVLIHSLGMRLLVVGLVMVPQVLLVLEHLITVFTLE